MDVFNFLVEKRLMLPLILILLLFIVKEEEPDWHSWYSGLKSKLSKILENERLYSINKMFGGHSWKRKIKLGDNGAMSVSNHWYASKPWWNKYGYPIGGIIVSVIMIVFLPQLSFIGMAGATITSDQTGNSNAGATWVDGSVPAAGDDVVIAAGHTVTTSADWTVDNVTVNSTGILYIVTYDMIIGTSIASGTLANAGTVRMGDLGELKALSSSYVCTVNGAGTYDWDYGGSATDISLADLDITVAFTTGGAGFTISTTGSMEFEGLVTVSTGDTLTMQNTDIIEFGGTLWNNLGTMSGGILETNATSGVQRINNTTFDSWYLAANGIIQYFDGTCTFTRTSETHGDPSTIHWLNETAVANDDLVAYDVTSELSFARGIMTVPRYVDIGAIYSTGLLGDGSAKASWTQAQANWGSFYCYQGSKITFPNSTVTCKLGDNQGIFTLNSPYSVDAQSGTIILQFNAEYDYAGASMIVIYSAYGSPHLNNLTIEQTVAEETAILQSGGLYVDGTFTLKQYMSYHNRYGDDMTVAGATIIDNANVYDDGTQPPTVQSDWGNCQVINGGLLQAGSDTNYAYKFNSLVVDATSTLTPTSNTSITVDGENSSGYAIDIQGTIANTTYTLGINYTGAFNTNIRISPSSGELDELIINSNGYSATLMSTSTDDIDTHTITDGTLIDNRAITITSRTFALGDSGAFQYGGTRTDDTCAYTKTTGGTGGTATINTGVDLTSDTCTLNASSVANNTPGNTNWIDTISGTGTWTVTPGSGAAWTHSFLTVANAGISTIYGHAIADIDSSFGGF